MMFTHHIFQYLGCVEVFESRGMQVCEEAVKTLKSVSSEIYLDKLQTALTIKLKIQGIDSDWNPFFFGNCWNIHHGYTEFK